ncbi:MAG TPA: bifunctional YncE family protein/alkaline phosphatase family protein [Pirellulales bacterium]|nr:bifunctional YncE family protein/alkaline phosphatase family protein [Pirellulales bacterium]
MGVPLTDISLKIKTRGSTMIIDQTANCTQRSLWFATGGTAVGRAAVAVALVVICCLSAAAQTPATKPNNSSPVDDYDRSRVGDADPQRIVVPTNQVLSPLGRQVAYGGRPTDLALSPDGRTLAVLDKTSVLTIDPVAGVIVSRVANKARGSYAGLVFTPDGKQLLASSMKGSIAVFDVSEKGELTARDPIKLAPAPGVRSESALPIGLAIGASGRTLWAVLNLNNTLAEIELPAGRVKREIAVGNAPFGVAVIGSRAYVSNWAGRKPAADSVTAPAGIGGRVRVDPKRFIASDGSVSVVDLADGKQIAEIVVGLHPSAIVATRDGAWVLVANANSDTISVIETARHEVVETISTRPAEGLLFGSGPNALALTADGKTLYVSNGTNNAVAVVELTPPHSRAVGFLPTGWYPAGLALDEARGALYVANIKGVGARNTDWKGTRKVKDKNVFGYNSHDSLGTVSLLSVPRRGELAAHTARVLANNRQSETTSALAPPRANAPPRAIPQRHGEPSKIKHVLYIIKENRTYDQVFGDVERGEGDKELCIFGAEVTPNHHRLADEFVLLDNFYCSGELSADGHQWATEAYVTDYLEKAFGEFVRSYPYDGGDAMAYASSGFLWDAVLARQKGLRVYGEFVKAAIRWKDPARAERPGFLDCYQDYLAQAGQIEIRATASIESLAPHICPTAIGFPGIVSDVYRAGEFIRELKNFEAAGKLPDLMIMLLPNDHTSGTRPRMPTPEAAVADNDLALGRVIEAVSHSKFWSDTAIFVVEDDPQNGFDHVDGHRTVALVASPYARRHALDSTNYNQTSLIRTIELILGLPPMNQLDGSATAMTNCFTDEPNLAAYSAVENKIPLDRLNPDLTSIRDQQQLHWANASLELPLDDVDRADENTLNRILWHAARGRDDSYPAWAVSLIDDDDDDDDD